MKTSLHLSGRVLDFLKTYPHNGVWLDISTDDGTISLSRDDGKVIFKDKGHVVHVPDPQRNQGVS